MPSKKVELKKPVGFDICGDEQLSARFDVNNKQLNSKRFNDKYKHVLSKKRTSKA